MEQSGLKAGFSSVRLIRDNRSLDPSYWSIFLFAMSSLGIPRAKIEQYKFVADAYKNTFGAFPELLYEPMGYFCFEK